jgi:hypothetical protein
MRAGPSWLRLASAVSYGCRVSSWLGSSLLAADVPIMSGRVAASVSQEVPERATLRIPPRTVEMGRTTKWLPGSPGEPLARYGQVLDITIASGGVDSRIGRFLIHEWSEQSSGEIEVTALGLLQWPKDDRLLLATGPRDDGTLKSEALRMLPGYMTAGFSNALTDRAVPRTMEWDLDRLSNLYKIADSWPARIRTDSWGQVLFLPPLPAVATPVLTIRDGEGGTLLEAPVTDSRDAGYNVFVARSSADGVDLQGIARISSGPMNPDGPYRPVPKFFASPLLLTQAQCDQAAVTMRDESARKSRIRKVTFAPDPRVELDDPVEIITGYGTPDQVREWGYVVGYDLPLTITDGPSRIDVATF